MTEINRLFGGARSDYEVETVFAVDGDLFRPAAAGGATLLVLTEGSLSLRRTDCAEQTLHVATELVDIPAGVLWEFTVHATPTRVVLVFPEGTGAEQATSEAIDHSERRR